MGRLLVDHVMGVLHELEQLFSVIQALRGVGSSILLGDLHVTDLE